MCPIIIEGCGGALVESKERERIKINLGKGRIFLE